jgi:hypothetical protein
MCGACCTLKMEAASSPEPPAYMVSHPIDHNVNSFYLTEFYIHRDMAISCILLWRLHSSSIFQVDSLAAASQCVDLLELNKRDMLSAIRDRVVTLWQRVAINELLTAEETSVKGLQWMNNFVSVLCSVSAPLVLHMNNSQLIQVSMFSFWIGHHNVPN